MGEFAHLVKILHSHQNRIFVVHLLCSPCSTVCSWLFCSCSKAVVIISFLPSLRFSPKGAFSPSNSAVLWERWVRPRPRQRLPPAGLALWEPHIRASPAVFPAPF